MAQLGFSIAAKLIEVLGSEAINKACEVWGYTSELKELQQTVSTIKMVFLDADAKWDHLSNQDKDFIRKLRVVVYDADDVFDEFFTLAQLNQLDGRPKKLDMIFRKVCRFFSSKNHVGEAYRMSCQVKDIKRRLDAIASDRAKFNIGVDLKPISRRPKETCSYVNVTDIVGRDKDKEIIINLLLAPNASENAPDILAIVGVGGIGKTALAQLVFNDEKIKQEFLHLTCFRLWVCVSDQDGDFDDKGILCKILELVTKERPDNNSTKELIQTQFQETMEGKKFLLVLDDVWNENRDKWLDLEKFLRIGHEGSKIIVTTRSEETTTIIGSEHVYKLDGLSLEYSQRLFEMSAFPKGKEPGTHNELVEIGRKIVEKWYHIPLALKVVGSLLYGQDIKKWRSIQDGGLAKIGNGYNGIFNILKLSYYNLEPSLQSCFSYCALFPKDFEIEKEKIIGIWLAQDYIAPLEGGQNLEDSAEEHFVILLRRCFFQDVKLDEYGDVKSVQIRDLMHDLAQEVGKEEIYIATSEIEIKGDKIRHLYDGNGYLRNSILHMKIRSYFGHFGCLEAQISKWMHLRVLILSHCGVCSVPDSICKLLHLRYLDLSKNDNVQLRESITELYNLQTLNLDECRELMELPKGISKLVNLRYLNLNESGLSSMPSGMDKLTNLRVLTIFMAGYTKIMSYNRFSNKKRSGNVAVLSDLKAFSKIKGKLCVKIGKKYKNVKHINGNDGWYLKSMEDLRELEIDFGDETKDIEDSMDKLEPPPNLKKLALQWYKGKRLGRWGSANDNWVITFPHLVHIELSCCKNLEQMPVLSKLPHLKSLSLSCLDSIEYMENGTSSNSRGSNTEATTTQFFPSLESLEICNLPKLKEWWKGEEVSLIFPNLSVMKIKNCPNLAVNLICPRLEKLELWINIANLQITCGALQDNVIKLRTFMVNEVGQVKLLPTKLGKDNEIKGGSLIEEVEKAFGSSAYFLFSLFIQGGNFDKRKKEVSICEEEQSHHGKGYTYTWCMWSPTYTLLRGGYDLPIILVFTLI